MVCEPVHEVLIVIRSNLRAFVVPVLLFFTLATVTAPARAVVFLVPPVVALVGASGTATTINAGATAAVLVVGALMSAVVLNGMSSTASQKILTGSKVPTPTPAGYTAPVSPLLEPNPPVNAAQYTEYRVDYSGSTNGLGYVVGASAVGACNSFVAMWNIQYPAANGQLAYDSVSPTTCNYHFVQSGQSSARSAFTQQVCPLGYTVVSTSCTLSSPALVPFPVEVQPTARPTPGTSPALLPVPGSKPLPAVNFPGAGIQQGINENNMPMNISVNPLPLPNGQTGTQTKYTSEVLDPVTGVTNTKTTSVKTDENGIVTEITVSVLPQSMSGTQTSGSPSAAINFPTDYNREITQAQVKANLDVMKADGAEVKTNTHDIASSLDGSTYVMPVAAATTPKQDAAAESKKLTDELDKSVEAYNNFKLLDWSTWIPTLPAAGCSPFTGNVSGRQVSFDICPKIALLNELLGWLLAVWSAWSIVSLLFRKD